MTGHPPGRAASRGTSGRSGSTSDTWAFCNVRWGIAPTGLDAVQEQSGFAPGEVRVVMVESQPLFGRSMYWKVVDAATGVLAGGETELAPMRAPPPWPTGPHADAMPRGSARASA